MITSSQVIIDGKERNYSRLTVLVPRIDILHWLDAQSLFPKFYWQSDKEFAALGALETWDHLPIIDSDPLLKLRLCGGRVFRKGSRRDPCWKDFKESYFFLPLVELSQNELSLNFLDTEPSDEGLRSLCFPQTTSSFKPSEPFSREDLPEYPEWENMVKIFLNQSFGKVVLARRTTLVFSNVLHPLKILSEVRKKNPAKVVYAFQPENSAAFIGASPERLFRREERNVVCDIVAGTFVADQEKDNPKLMREFGYVKKNVFDILHPLCTSLTMQSEDSSIKAYQIQHLYNVISGVLKSDVNDGELIEALHPTPAIGGYPRDLALEFIAAHEPFDRGWYSAPLGFTSVSHAEFVVAIRSALINNHIMHLFAGLGLVEGSDPQLEWEELELKIGQYL